MIVSVPSSAFGREPVTGRVEEGDAASASRSPIARAAVGAIVDMSIASAALAEAVDGAVLAEQHLLDLGRVGDHRDDGGRALGRLRGVPAARRAVLLREALGLLARAVPDGQLEARAARGSPPSARP